VSDTIDQIPLDRAIVERFLAAAAALGDLQRRIDGTTGTGDVRLAEVPDGFAGDPETRRLFLGIISANGFADDFAWARALVSISLALGELDPEMPLSQAETEVRDEIARTRTDETLSEAEKADTIATLEGHLAELERMRPLTGNVDAVRPHVDRLTRILGGN